VHSHILKRLTYRRYYVNNGRSLVSQCLTLPCLAVTKRRRHNPPSMVLKCETEVKGRCRSLLRLRASPDQASVGLAVTGALAAIRPTPANRCMSPIRPATAESHDPSCSLFTDLSNAFRCSHACSAIAGDPCMLSCALKTPANTYDVSVL
jgi:hypothetical protein